MDPLFMNIENINENNGNFNRNNELKIDPLKKALEEAKNKLVNLLNNLEKFKLNNDSKSIQNVINENKYVMTCYKKDILSQNNNSNNSNNCMRKKLEEDINNKSNNYINKNCDRNSYKFIYPQIKKEGIKNVNDINYKKNYSKKYNDENNINRQVGEVRKGFYESNKNAQNLELKISNNNQANNLIYNNKFSIINSNININNPNPNDKIKFIGNKRNHDVRNNEKTEKEILYEEIKELYNQKKNNFTQENKIYEQKTGFFEGYETLIIDGKATCIVYLNRSLITKIYLISEQMTIEEDNDIIEVLNKIKNDLKKKL